MEAPGIFLTLFAFAITIGVLVFIHELGHYMVGRWCGVKAETFSIGFGKELAGWTDKRGTRWKLAALPLGGYVQFAGDMDPASAHNETWRELPPEECDHVFQAKPLWQRALIVFAGPAINFLFAMIILAGFAMAYGEEVTPAVAGAVQEDSAAEAMGIEPGDRIASLNGTQIDSFGELQRRVTLIPDTDATIEVERDGDIRTLSGRIGRIEIEDRFGNSYPMGQLGIARGPAEYRDVPLIEVPLVAVERTYAITEMIWQTLGQVITGARSVKELGGPLKIAQVSGEQFAAGLNQFVFFVALISINLGFINLLPIPLLDGGHLLFYAVEAIRRKPADPRVQEWAFRSGFALVVGFMLLVTFNDLSSFGLFRSLAG